MKYRTLLLLFLALTVLGEASKTYAALSWNLSEDKLPTSTNDNDGTKLSLRILSAFGVIDKDKDYSKDYTVAWARIADTNASKTKVGYLWNTHSFNIDRFFDATAAEGDETTELFYKTSETDAAFHELVGKNADATDSLSVQNIRVYSGDGVAAVNSHNPEGTAKTIFDIQQIVNYYGIIPTVFDNFKYSVVSPINYGIYRGGAKNVEATVNNVGSVAASMKEMSWVDYSNNMSQFTLNDSRIAMVKCELVKDEANNYALVKDKKVTYNMSSNQLEFFINYGAVTNDCVLQINVVVVDYWGIETTLPVTVYIRSSNGQVTNLSLPCQSASTNAIYGIDGAKHGKLGRGVNIIVTPDGKRVKVAGKE